MRIEGEAARSIARAALARYTALALMMPYEAFRTRAERLGHDPAALASRFEVDFALACERLVSLQDRSGGRGRGLPFFLLEVDHAGNILRRIGARGFPVNAFGGECPRLAIWSAFAAPGEAVAERVAMPDGRTFLTLSRTVEGAAVALGERPGRTALLLGLEEPASVQTKPRSAEGELAPARPAYASLLPDPAARAPTPVGPACRLCERLDCAQRAAPPLMRPQGLDTLAQAFGPPGLS